VITDTRLPGFDGYDLCEVLRRDMVMRGVRILVVTDESMPTELDRARDAGADAVLIKPVSPETLLHEVERLLKQPRDLGANPLAQARS
jgi:CheY-like chemotaxis protein